MFYSCKNCVKTCLPFAFFLATVSVFLVKFPFFLHTVFLPPSLPPLTQTRIHTQKHILSLFLTLQFSFVYSFLSLAAAFLFSNLWCPSTARSSLCLTHIPFFIRFLSLLCLWVYVDRHSYTCVLLSLSRWDEMNAYKMSKYLKRSQIEYDTVLHCSWH